MSYNKAKCVSGSGLFSNKQNLTPYNSSQHTVLLLLKKITETKYATQPEFQSETAADNFYLIRKS